MSLRQLLTNLFSSNESPFLQIEDVHELRETQTKLIAFELVFDDFVEMVASAQTYGPNNGMVVQYSSLKQQLEANYTALRPYLLAYIRLDIEDERVGLRLVGRGTDAFEATWAAPTLLSLLDSHDVFFRDRVARAKSALTDYTEHLHSLLETRV